MKKASHLLSVLFLMILVVFTSCKDDAPKETLEQKNTRLLTEEAFTVNEVSLTGDVDYSYTGGTTITFSENNTFNVSGGEALPGLGINVPFPASGDWSFTDKTNFDEITLTSGGEEVVLTLTTIDENNLVFSYDGVEVKEDVNVTVNASR